LHGRAGFGGLRREVRLDTVDVVRDVSKTPVECGFSPAVFTRKRRCAMSEKDIQKDDLVGKTKAIRDHDHDMIHDLSKRLDAVWRYDQYIENADKFPEVQRFWQESKQTEIQTIERLKELIREHVRKDNF
jgi:hypothetical protein